MLIQKNAKVKEILYRGLEENVFFKVCLFSFEKSIWDLLASKYGSEDIELALMALFGLKIALKIKRKCSAL